jgi:hypothetical protein
MFRIRWSLSTSLLVLAGGAIAEGQRIDVPLARLESTVDDTRVKAFYEMVERAGRGQGPAPGGSLGPRTDLLALRARGQSDLAVALIALLERETARINSAPRGSLPESFTAGYYPDVFVTVARMKDVRAVRALMPVIQNGDVVQTGIADLGEAAIPEVVGALSGGDQLRQFGAARTLGKIAARAGELNVSATSMATIRTALLGATTDRQNFILRKAAVEALQPFGDENVRVEMQRLATSDDYVLTGPDGRRVYPVREAADAWLRAHPRR